MGNISKLQVTEKEIKQIIVCSTFANKVKEISMKERSVEKKRFQLYDKPGRHTFFIPVDSAFNVSNIKHKRLF